MSTAGAPVRLELRPRSPFALPRRSGLDGLTRVRAGVLSRLVHVNEAPVVVRVAQPARDRVLFATERADRAAGAEAIERMRAALGVDLDLTAFYERFRFDPVIGGSVRRDPGLRAPGRPDPFEALAWAICEQLIEFERAAAIQLKTGDPYARATEDEVGEFFSRYDPWAGLAGLHALRAAPSLGARLAG